MVRAHVFINGRVQGVFFRAWIRDNAQNLGLAGWAKNLEDGRVEVVIEGDRDRVRELVRLMRGGPRLAKVEHIDVSWEEGTGEFDNFTITR